MQCDRIFVYGTLRKAARPDIHQRFLGSRSEFLGRGSVQGRLWRVSWYPAMTQCLEDRRVVGEVYRLGYPFEMIAELDEFEVCDLQNPSRSEYTREVVNVTMDTDSELSAWCYFFLGSIKGLTPIESGDFAEGQSGAGR